MSLPSPGLLLAPLCLALACWVGPATAQAPAAMTDRPMGFARGVTGGEGGVIVRPRTLDALRLALCDRQGIDGRCLDDTPRIITLDHSFDFTGSVLRDGLATATQTGCVARQCPAGKAGQWALDVANFCAGRPPATVTYDNAGRSPLPVGSNKTIRGEGGAGAIKGRGLTVSHGAHNVIIQNITVSDINPSVIWGGDALTLDDADGVWVDHDTFARVGRQMIVTGFGAATHVTLSHNLFDGRTPNGVYCDGAHYWLWLFLGRGDTITLYANHIRDTAGRGPHAGGMNGATNTVQMVDNLFSDVRDEGAAAPLTPLAHLLMEGNIFIATTHPVYRRPDKDPGPGLLYAPFSSAGPWDDAVCRRHLGRACAANIADGPAEMVLDEGALAAFDGLRDFLVTPGGQDADAIAAHAGAGADTGAGAPPAQP